MALSPRGVAARTREELGLQVALITVAWRARRFAREARGISGAPATLGIREAGEAVGVDDTFGWATYCGYEDSCWAAAFRGGNI